MTDLANSDVFLVGSVPVPGDNASDVFRLCGPALGDRVFALPDGEFGPRRMWIGALGQTTFSRHPDLVPDPELASLFEAYRRKPGLTSISLDGYLPYGDAALASYEYFRALRDDGVIARNVRFQVSLPTPHAAIGGYFGQIADWPMLQQSYQAAVVADIRRMLEHIPADDLVIQWDYCTELLDIVGAYTGRREFEEYWSWSPKTSFSERFEQYTSSAYVAPLTEFLPDQVLCGYHLCLGTYPKCPMVQADDLGVIVRVANALVANTPRRVDFLHLPVVPGAEKGYFAPLTDLNAESARVFLGLELKDGRRR